MKYYAVTDDPNELMHYGVLGMKWGVIRTDAQLGHPKKPSKPRSSAYKKASNKLSNLMRHGIAKVEASWKSYNSPKAKKARQEKRNDKLFEKHVELARQGRLKYKGISDAEVNRITDRLALERQARALSGTEKNSFVRRLGSSVSEGIISGAGQGMAAATAERWSRRSKLKTRRKMNELDLEQRRRQNALELKNKIDTERAQDRYEASSHHARMEAKAQLNKDYYSGLLDEGKRRGIRNKRETVARARSRERQEQLQRLYESELVKGLGKRDANKALGHPSAGYLGTNIDRYWTDYGTSSTPALPESTTRYTSSASVISRSPHIGRRFGRRLDDGEIDRSHLIFGSSRSSRSRQNRDTSATTNNTTSVVQANNNASPTVQPHDTRPARTQRRNNPNQVDPETARYRAGMQSLLREASERDAERAAADYRARQEAHNNYRAGIEALLRDRGLSDRQVVERSRAQSRELADTRAEIERWAENRANVKRQRAADRAAANYRARQSSRNFTDQIINNRARELADTRAEIERWNATRRIASDQRDARAARQEELRNATGNTRGTRYTVQRKASRRRSG